MNAKFSFAIGFLTVLSIAVAPGCGNSKKMKGKPVAAKSTGISETKSTASKQEVVERYAQILEISVNETLNEKLYLFVDEWQGVPYRYGGKDKNGIDCSAFSGYLYREVYGIQLPRTTTLQAQSVSKVHAKFLQEGDLVFFTIQGNKDSHVGVYLKNHRFVHASTSKGVVVSDLRNPYYKENFSMGGRVK